ncbi:transposase family protein, partial [Streptomyces sp. CoT10]|uniref:transposase family protein n=1 Tax=Streptomyces sp. CoT10 TaxID=2875762 RepID=UPI001CD6EFA6
MGRGPSQVFTWDITKLAGPVKGIWHHACVIVDIFSRCIVGHTVGLAESADRAEELIRETIDRNGIVPETVHASRGTSMTSKKVSRPLIGLGVTGSHSDPGPATAIPAGRATSQPGPLVAEGVLADLAGGDGVAARRGGLRDDPAVDL